MIKTYNIELEMSEELYEHWKGVLEMSRSMYNDMSEILWEHRTEKLSITAVHHLTYNAMREKYPEIPSQAVIKTYKGLLSNYRSNKKKFKCEKKQLSMNLDKRLYSRLTPTSIDLSGKEARKRRTTVKFKMYGKFQELASQYPMKDPSIFMKDGRIFLGVPFEIPAKPVVEESCLGVDLGIRRFFTTSDGVAIKTNKLNALKRRIRHNKRILQSKKRSSHSARTKLKKLSHRESNINREYTHQLVNELLKTDKTVIVLENLTGLKQKTSKTKEGYKKKRHNNMISQVPFYMFRDILTYKALLLGKRVATVSPTYTSQTDCLTGKRDGTRQGTRYYSVSGKVYDADWNAAINIVNRYKRSVSFIEPICGTLNFIRQGACQPPNGLPTDRQAASSLDSRQLTEIPSAGNFELRAGLLAKAAEGYEAAMVGGAPYLMPALARHLSECNVKPLCSFTERKSVERPNEKDGSVEKVSVFEHIGFVEMPL